MCKIQAKSGGVQQYFWLIASFSSSKSITGESGVRKNKGYDLVSASLPNTFLMAVDM